MTSEEIEALLFEEEGTTLDFKRDQYPFDKASDMDKSELLKDILAFANAFRRTDAYILIGVDDVKGGRSKVVGVASQLDDAKLQQFVNSKTQRPVTFSYRDAQHDGLPIGIIHMPLQQRPLYTKSDYGKVKKETVYLRRGSSTGTASLDEVAHMGAQYALVHGVEPSFDLELFDRSTGQTLGHKITLRCLLLDVPAKKDIPDYAENGLGLVSFGINRDYYRDLAEFTHIINLVHPVSLALRNTSSVSAHDVRLVFEIDDPGKSYTFVEESDIPRNPVSRDPLSIHRMHIPTNFNSTVDVTRTGDRWRIECRFGKIQPHDTVRLADDLYIGARTSGTLTMEVKLYADNISRPLPFRLELCFDVEEKAVSLEEIERMEYERFISTPEGKKLLAEMEKDEGD